MSQTHPIHEGQVLTGPFFNEPMRVETVASSGDGAWVVGLVGMQTERFRRVTLTEADLAALAILESVSSYDGDGKLLRLGLQAYSLGIAYEFDPYFGLSISKVDPLPHQLEAVYDYLLKLSRVRFLLADDAGAGKTIMAGLLIRELQLRGLAERILVVCPANLSFQWQRELKEKFDEKFLVLKGGDIRNQFGVNQWLEQKKVITSLDLAKRTEILPGLRQVHWDLVIVDEAHRMSWTPPARKTARYALGELLRDSCDHILLLTATPHKGDPVNFSLFLGLLDPDAYADVKSIREAMDRRRAPFYLRRTKEAMVYFPERRPDGTWAAEKIFTKRITNTVDFRIDGLELDLYREITRFVKRQSGKAAAQGDDPRARAVGFLMSLYQRRLASSTYAMRHSLENRASKLEEGLKQAQKLARLAPPDLPALPDPEELEEMEETERDRLEQMLEAITLAGKAEQVREEIAELRQLAEQAQAVEGADSEAKLSKLKDLLHQEGFFDHPDKRLLLFTEFKDTLDYLVGKLKSWGFRVGCIHGSMRSGSRDEPGTRLHAEQQFKDGAIQVLVATEAAGEGINLQCCHILFNYDIPWNPNRLEQRMGRIHRYGQRKDCLIFNFVATNTIEGRVLQRLLEKLQEIRDALNDDAVFNVVGEILPAAHVERILRDYYAGKLGDADLEERLLENVDEGRFRAICQNALEGLASKKLNLKMLMERRARAQERRVVPETIARFLSETAGYANLVLKPAARLPHTFEPGKTPTVLRRYERDPDWRLPALAGKYPRLSTDRDTAEKHHLEWVTPGHPLFEAMRRHTFHLAQEDLKKGACFYSLAHDAPARIDFYRARVVDGLGHVVHERLFAVELADGRAPCRREPALLGDLIPTEPPQSLPAVAALPEATAWFQSSALASFLEEVRSERQDEVERVVEHVELSLTELLARADQEIGKAQEAIERGDQGAEGRLAQAEARHAELLARRERRRKELQQERSLTLQAVERLTSVLVLPHPERESPEVRQLRPNLQTEAIAMQVAIEYEKSQGRQVYDVHEKNLGYDLTSLDLRSGELRLIEVKGLADATGTILLTPNERRVAEDRRDCYWLYVVTNCAVAQASSLHASNVPHASSVAQASSLHASNLHASNLHASNLHASNLHASNLHASNLHASNLHASNLQTGWHGRGYLPHLKSEGGTYFVTFRLADTLPAAVLEAIEQERDALERLWLAARGSLTEAEVKRLNALRSERIEAYLDAGEGACWLRDPAMATMVLQALRHFDGERYVLHAAVVMPNHVHALLTPLGTHVLSAILHSWKSFTATQANRILRREGKEFWQRESYDHLIRDDDDYQNHLRYILENPDKAGLRDWPYVHVAPEAEPHARTEDAGRISTAEDAGRMQAAEDAGRMPTAEDAAEDAGRISTAEDAGRMPTAEDAGRMPALHAIKDPARFPWHEVTKVAHYWLEVDAMTRPMQVREDSPPYGGR